MKRTEIFKDERAIDNEMTGLKSICAQLETNMNRLDKMNALYHTFDKDLIYEISFACCHIHGGRYFKRLCEEVGKLYPLQTPSKVEKDVWDALSIIHGLYPGIGQMTDEFRKNEYIVTIRAGYDDYTQKDDFVFDYENNKVTISEATIKKIEETHTYFIENETQQKVCELSKDIVDKINKLNEIYRKQGVSFCSSGFVGMITNRDDVKKPYDLNFGYLARYAISFFK